MCNQQRLWALQSESEARLHEASRPDSSKPPNSDQSAASRLWELGVSWTPFSLDVSVFFFLHQMTKLCTPEWSTRARQLYIKPFVHYQHSRVFPVYASRGDRDDVWRATVALNDPAAMSQKELTVQQMQTDVRLSADKWNFSFWIFFFFGGGGVFVRSIFTIRFFSLSLSGRGKKILVLMEDWKGSKQGPLFGRWLIRWDGAKNNISGLFGPQLSRKNGG